MSKSNGERSEAVGFTKEGMNKMATEIILDYPGLAFNQQATMAVFDALLAGAEFVAERQQRGASSADKGCQTPAPSGQPSPYSE